MDFTELVRVGAHFGHLKSRLNPKMSKYIWGIKNNVHLIDVSKSAFLIEKAAKFLSDTAAEGKPILWIGTKKAACNIISDVAKKLDMPSVSHRWIGGTLSNYSQVKKSVTKLLHYEDIISKSDKFPHYTKKELVMFAKVVDRLKKNIGGIARLTWPIGAIVLVDVNKEMSALREAFTMGIPVVAIIDTNGDPSLVDYVIPANDDSSKTINLILGYLADSIIKGQKIIKDNKKSSVDKPENYESKMSKVKSKEDIEIKKTAIVVKSESDKTTSKNSPDSAGYSVKEKDLKDDSSEKMKKKSF